MSESLLKSLGSRIRARRKELDLSQDDVANAAGVTQGAVSQWELGLTEVRRESLARLASRLQTTPSELLSDGSASYALTLNENTLAASIACLEAELASKFQQLTPVQKAKLLAYVYNKGGALPKQELLSLLVLVK